jgi:serine phosphatase RsbU (regulator of sigma subunit)
MTGTKTRIAGIVAGILVVFVLVHTTGQSGRAGIGFFYTVPIGLATWWFGWRAGLATVIACIGMLAVSAALGGTSPAALPVTLRIVAMFAMWGGITAVRRQEYELQVSRTELSAIRAALTPPLPDAAGIDVAAAFVASDHGVSGDFYLVTNSVDGKSVIVVGDVTGHGLASARLATFARTSIASYAAYTADPAEILTLANRALAEQHENSDQDFVTAVCLTYDPGEHSFEWAVAGHPVPLRLPDLQEIGQPSPGLPLGVDRDLVLESSTSALTGDQGVLIYTDGATEARGSGDFLGLPGLRRMLSPIATLPVEQLVDKTESALLDFSSSGLRDDLCVLALRPRES